MAFSILLAVVTVILTLYIPILVGRAVDHIVAKGLVDFGGVLSVLIQIGMTAVVTAVLQWIMNTINNKVDLPGGAGCEKPGGLRRSRSCR